MQVSTSKPIRIIATDAGTHIDMLARLIAAGISSPLGRPVTVENYRGTQPGEIVAQSAPDGGTLLVTGGNFWYARLIKRTPYDPVRDFAPISLATISPLMLVVHPRMSAGSVEDLIALARARPGELSYASGMTGHSSQLAGALFTSLAGVDIRSVPCKESGLDGISDVIAGKVDLMIPSAGAVIPHVKSCKVKALAVTSARPSALFPDLPTIADSGVPGYEIVQSIGVFAPANTDASVIERLNREIASFLNRPDIKERLLGAGLEAVGSTSAEFAAKIDSEMIKWGRLIKGIGIEATDPAR